ncbi:MAG: translation elongation factor 4 [Myxococcota bacterium]
MSHFYGIVASMNAERDILIRNFSIIAHIDHGKSTLADRILELTGSIKPRDKKEQYLDSMDLERERGITIKSSAVRQFYKADDGKTYMFNIIDTPGHVDFSYEVSRALGACEGALLVVDAVQGVQAQTLANVYLALENNLEIVPVINKIDLPAANVDKVRAEIKEIIGLDGDSAILVSAKTGQGIKELLEEVILRIPPPKRDFDAPTKALIFDSWFDNYLGVISLIRIKEGEIRKGMRIRLMATGKEYDVTQLGVYTPYPAVIEELKAGEVGFVAASIKEVAHARIGDTITSSAKPAAEPLPGFKEAQPMVFCGIFPTEPAGYDPLKDALEKLRLNDSAFRYEPETSQALGFGFRAGFLGLLHMEIVQERLEREYDLDIITTAPTVVYEVITTDGTMIKLDNPAKLPDVMKIKEIREPVIMATIHCPDEYVGAILSLCEERRGVQNSITYSELGVVSVVYKLPLLEVIYNFYDRLKSSTRGYASLDYELAGYEASDLVKLDILLNGDPVDALSVIVHRSTSFYRGQELARKMKKVIPRQMYEVAIQAAIGRKVIARTTVKALRKNVTAKCYGGDITRKRKLLEKQKAGKKRMRKIGRIEVPQEAFLSVLSADDED